MSRWRRMPGIIAVLGAASCQPPQFRCSDDGQCASDQGMGRCEPQGYCSFPDEDCPSGWAFEAYAADGLAGQCVFGAGNSSSTSTESQAPPEPSTSGVGFIFLVNETRLELRRGGEEDNGSWGSDADLEVGTWHHVAVVFDDDDPDAGASFWLDGVPTGSTEIMPLVGEVQIDPMLETRLGRAPPELGNLEGRLDEVRLSTVARSGEWIEHQVLSDVDALLDYGPAETSTCSGEG